ncbi:MAG: GntR family transcriptional regulator, partial [Anaerovoracaceae bacterium]|nr:GntR family transcriptional regulator [Anaerovoracaceae bacterium]
MKSERSLKESIYNAVLEDILALEYRPGEILNEKNLIEKYQCSKSPVREALQALCADNVLRNIPRYGYEVVRLTMEDIYEMIQFRYILESSMLQLNI